MKNKLIIGLLIVSQVGGAMASESMRNAGNTPVSGQGGRAAMAPAPEPMFDYRPVSRSVRHVTPFTQAQDTELAQLQQVIDDAKAEIVLLRSTLVIAANAQKEAHAALPQGMILEAFDAAQAEKVAVEQSLVTAIDALELAEETREDRVEQMHKDRAHEAATRSARQ